MFEALYIGATGMRGQQLQIDTIAQNVANLNTVGYRRRTVSFAEVAAAIANDRSVNIIDNVSTLHAPLAAPSLMSAGSMPIISLANTAGELKQTDDPMNVAIDGPGFIEVIRADGTPAYTRAGQFRINSEGMLTTLDGSVLASRVQVPGDARAIRIDARGTVTALVGDQGDPVELGVIELAQFANPAGLRAVGDSIYAATEQSGNPVMVAAGENGVGTFRQGFVETANVQMSDELVNLMLAQRSFELNSKVIQAADQLLSITNGLYR
jgi:flagellar basal-body rod protein FlgG